MRCIAVGVIAKQRARDEPWCYNNKHWSGVASVAAVAGVAGVVGVASVASVSGVASIAGFATVASFVGVATVASFVGVAVAAIVVVSARVRREIINVTGPARLFITSGYNGPFHCDQPGPRTK